MYFHEALEIHLSTGKLMRHPGRGSWLSVDPKGASNALYLRGEFGQPDSTMPNYMAASDEWTVESDALFEARRTKGRRPPHTAPR
jgi:hypothetical protein